jgi:hypothetical protein
LYSQGDKLAVRADLDSLAADVQVKYITHTVKQTIQGECVKTRLMKIQAWFFWIAIAGIAVFIYFKIKP